MNIEEFSEIPKAIHRSIDRQPLRDDKYDFIFFVNYALIFFDSRNWIRSCGDECYENIGRPSHVYRVGESGISWVLLTVAYIVIAIKPVQISNGGCIWVI